MNLISAPRPFAQRARRAARLGLDIPRGYFAFIVGMPFYHTHYRPRRSYRVWSRALHLRRCLERRARDRGWQHIRPYLCLLPECDRLRADRARRLSSELNPIALATTW